MLRYKTETRPGLVALYDIRPGNEAGQFLQPRSPHGVQVCKRKCSTLKELIPFNSDQNTLTNRKWVVNNCGQPALSTSSSDWRTCAILHQTCSYVSSLTSPSGTAYVWQKKFQRDLLSLVWQPFQGRVGHLVRWLSYAQLIDSVIQLYISFPMSRV